MLNTQFIGFYMSPQKQVTLKLLNSEAVGSTQASRSLMQLANEYFVIEERSLSDWLNYIAKFSQQIAFIDQQLLNKSGSWQAAMPSIEQAQALEKMLQGQSVPEELIILAQRPDMALLLAFFQMMKMPQDQFKNFTSQHKQFYYRRVLGFKETPEVADKAHLVVKLADTQKSKTLLKGSQFIGGEDADGTVLIYENNKNAVLNHSQVSKVLTLSKMPDDTSSEFTNQRLLLSKGYQVEQGQEFPTTGILTFGDATVSDDTRQGYSQVGFTLASQHLYLSSGIRIIDITLKFKDDTTWLSNQKEISALFELNISTAEGFVTLDSEVSEIQEEGGIKITITLDQFFPAICPFVDEEQPLLPELPHISFILNEQAHLDTLSKAYFNAINLAVEVKGLKGVVANHDVGSLDTTKPFEPFTYAPRIASRFDFTHPELLIKNINQAELNLNWVGRPENVVDYYKKYADYRDKTNTVGSDDYLPWRTNKAAVFYSDSLQEINTVNVFSNDALTNNIDKNTINFIEESIDLSNQIKTSHAYSVLPLTNLQANQWPKWFSLVLSNNDFGHSDHAQVVQQFALKGEPIPDPYTPLLNEISINYKSQVDITLSNQNQPFQQLHHIHPLGRPRMADSSVLNIALLPKFRKWGYLYIGVAEVPSPGQFRLYFQLDPVDGSNITEQGVLDWSYLDDKGWHTFSRSQGGRLENRARIIEDSTYNLLDSGIMVFELPELPLNNNFMGDDLFWLRISIEDAKAQISKPLNPKYSRIRNIFAQGIEVQLAGSAYHQSHYEEPLAAESIAAQLETDPQISEIIQPYASYAGKKSEVLSALEVRASERLKHKNRALTQWDYEQLVLAQFPELFMARCYRDTTLNIVEMVVVPINHDPSILQPKVALYLKRRIQRFLQTVSVPELDVRVIDPVYEEVIFDATLNIALDYDKDGVVAELNQILIDYLTPWNKKMVNIGSSLNKNTYLTAVAEKLEYHPAVNFVYVLRATVDDVLQSNIIKPSKDSAILVPVADHKISLLNNTSEIFEGIGKWRIGDDLEIL